jgi:hypothetical protein
MTGAFSSAFDSAFDLVRNAISVATAQTFTSPSAEQTYDQPIAQTFTSPVAVEVSA